MIMKYFHMPNLELCSNPLFQDWRINPLLVQGVFGEKKEKKFSASMLQIASRGRYGHY